jgi:streptogramin lyase
MKEKLRSASILVLTIVILIMASTRLPADTGTCGGANASLPFTDVMGNFFFCEIAEAYFSGLTNGTTPTTYSPSDNVLREQMAAFVTRTQDSALRRGSRPAALSQWATPAALPASGRTALGPGAIPILIASDGVDLWVTDIGSAEVKRVRASDGRVLETWTGATAAYGVLIARGRIYVTGRMNPGRLYVIDPTAAPGAVTVLNANLGNSPQGVTTDGNFIWTANVIGSVSRVDPDSGALNNFTAGLGEPEGILFDGANLWVTDNVDSTLKKLDSNGGVIQSVPVGTGPLFPVFDGSNIWVPNSGASNSVTVVRARDGQVLATLTGNGLLTPWGAAFDGQRVLVTNLNGNSVSVWKAADMTPLGSFATGPGTGPTGACSDGINFRILLSSTNQLARF